MSEERFRETVYTGMSKTKHGRLLKVIGIRCPFCGTVTEARVWSLAGVGKKCDCGAKHLWKPEISIKERN